MSRRPLNVASVRRGLFEQTTNCLLYTSFPCHECAKTLVQAGIGEVVYLDDKYHSTEDGLISRNILDRCGITYRQVGVQIEG